MQTLFRSATLTTTHLWFTVRATTVLELDAYIGELIHVEKNVVKGNDWYRIQPNAETA